MNIFVYNNFVRLGVPYRTHCAGSPAPCTLSDRPGAACLVLSADRCSVSSVWACVSCLVWSALHLVRPVLLPVMCKPSGCAGAGVSTGGVYSRRPAPPGQSFNHRKNKKGSKNTLPLLPISKISRKNKKTPTKGLCYVLYLPYKP